MLIRSDARHIPLADESVHCVVTSPPYFGLRDYGLDPSVWGGDRNCEHRWGKTEKHGRRGNRGVSGTGGNLHPSLESSELGPGSGGGGSYCDCSAWFGCLGLEPDFEMHLEHLVEIFREVKRVLRHDGCLFLNCGDAHASCKMFSHQVKLREDMTEDEYVEAALALSRGMSELWAEDGERTSEGPLSELLQQSGESAIHGRPRVAETHAESVQSIPCEAQDSSQPETSTKEQGNTSLCHREAGKPMRLLRRDGIDVPVSRPHQGRRKERIQEAGKLDASLQAGIEGGSSEGQISHPLLELQRRPRNMGLLSSLVIDKSDIPAGAERFFEPIYSLKPKDLMMMPERIAMALQADGWWLRQKIPWLKRNPMPESTKDRPTNALEFVYLLTKTARNFYDRDAVRIRPKGKTDKLPDGWDTGRGSHGTIHKKGRSKGKRKTDKQRGHVRTHDGFNDRWDQMSKEEQQSNGRSFRNTDLMFQSLKEPWGLIMDSDGNPLAIDVPPKGFKGAHFATFPEKLVTPFILAGTSEKGCCPDCGAPWERVTEYRLDPTSKAAKRSILDSRDEAADANDQGHNRQKDGHIPGWVRADLTTGWRPTCEHGKTPVPCVVLDPFSGSGTVVRVATRFNRRGIGCDLAYHDIAKKRTSNIQRRLL